MTITLEGAAHLTWIHDGRAERLTLPVTHETEPDWDLDFRYVEFHAGLWEITFYLWTHDDTGPHVGATWQADPTLLPGWAEWLATPVPDRLVSCVLGSGRPDMPNLPPVVYESSEGVAALKADLTSLGLGFVIAPVLRP